MSDRLCCRVKDTLRENQCVTLWLANVLFTLESLLKLVFSMRQEIINLPSVNITREFHCHINLILIDHKQAP